LIVFIQGVFFVQLPKTVGFMRAMGHRHVVLLPASMQFIVAHPDVVRTMALIIAGAAIWALLSKRGAIATKYLAAVFWITFIQIGLWTWSIAHIPFSTLVPAIH
jgi:hypothetical protein